MHALDKADGPLREMHKLTPEHLDPSSKARMRVYLAKQVISKSVADFARKKNEELDGLLDSLIEFLEIYNKMFKAMSSEEPLYNINDDRVATVCAFMNWHDVWAKETGHEGNKHTTEFISYELFYDLRLLCYGFLALILTHLGDGDNIKYIVPRDINQDVVENLFGRIRRMTGGQRHPGMLEAARAVRHLHDQQSRTKKERSRVHSVDDEWHNLKGSCRGKFKVQRVLRAAPATMRAQKPRNKRWEIDPAEPTK